ncbi:MAG TPA: methyltransferase domain-containing protein [Chitinophagaceae bacterium]|nr:methyltransferase domain-containing protein [Chitinophagaceae bacterium]
MNKTPANEVQDVKNFFHGYASDFDSIYGHTKTRGGFDKLMDKLFRKSMLLRFNETLRETAKPSIHSILDVGCGSGVYCVEFLKQGKEVVGLDIAEGMLEIAKQKTAEYNNSGKISFVLSGYMEHEFQRRFDAAVLMGFFDYIKDPVELIKKLQIDVTKEIYMSFPKKGGFLTWQRKLRYNMRNCPLYFYSKKSLTNILDQADLQNRYTIKDLGRDFFVKATL